MKSKIYQYRLLDTFFKLHIPLSWDIKGWEQVTNQPHNDGDIIGDNLGQIEVSKSTHQDLHIILY